MSTPTTPAVPPVEPSPFYYACENNCEVPRTLEDLPKYTNIVFPPDQVYNITVGRYDARPTIIHKDKLTTRSRYFAGKLKEIPVKNRIPTFVNSLVNIERGTLTAYLDYVYTGNMPVLQHPDYQAVKFNVSQFQHCDSIDYKQCLYFPYHPDYNPLKSRAKQSQSTQTKCIRST